jgi:hypothetical protein
MITNTMTKYSKSKLDILLYGKTKSVIFYLFVCLNTNKDEYGGIGFTFSTIFNSDKRRGLKEICVQP